MMNWNEREVVELALRMVAVVEEVVLAWREVGLVPVVRSLMVGVEAEEVPLMVCLSLLLRHGRLLGPRYYWR